MFFGLLGNWDHRSSFLVDRGGRSRGLTRNTFITTRCPGDHGLKRRRVDGGHEIWIIRWSVEEKKQERKNVLFCESENLINNKTPNAAINPLLWDIEDSFWQRPSPSL